MLDYEITAPALAMLLKDTTVNPAQGNNPTILDVREPWEFTTAHIEGSILIPMGDIPSRANQELDPDGHIIVLCHAGIRSMNVTVWLRNNGFEKAQSVRGGIDAWSRKVDPSVPRY